MTDPVEDDGSLSEKDLLEVLETLLDAKDKAYYIGLALNLPPGEVKSICSSHKDPQECLTAVIEFYLRQVKPRPSWRAIAVALRHSLVTFPRIAETVESAKLPTASEIVSRRLQKFENTTTTLMEEKQKASVPGPADMPQKQFDGGQVDTVSVKARIEHLEEWFNHLKWGTRDILQASNVSVKKTVDALADIPIDDHPDHKLFFDGHLTVLYKAGDQVELFGTLTFHMNYLSYYLVDYLIHKFMLGIKEDMEKYKEAFKQFRETIPLKIFCETQTKHRIKPSGEFREMVAEFKWPNNTTLEVVEQFRKEYAFHYNLRDCAMMLAEICLGSFIVTWFIHQSVISLFTQVPEKLLNRYSATILRIGGCCVFYQDPCEFDGGRFEDTSRSSGYDGSIPEEKIPEEKASAV